MAVLVREVVCNDWVARKLEIDLKLTEEPIDFERFKANGIQAGEVEMLKSDDV